MKKLYLWVFSFATAVNLLLVSHIETSGNIRDGLEQNYFRAFTQLDIAIFLLLLVALYKGADFGIKRIMPRLQAVFKAHFMEHNQKWKAQHIFVGTFLVIMGVWFFFFLVLYPGTAMNDTIFILQNPKELCYQHPVLYIMYTYFFYHIGVACGNPNAGLALLSLSQMLAMDYVISYAITQLYQKKITVKLCALLASYFAFAPLFSTYAVSAIKDTPFSIALFYLVILLWELADSKGKRLEDVGFCIKNMIAIFIITGFRSNGFMIAMGTLVILLIAYKQKWKVLLVSFFAPIVIAGILSEVFMPMGVEELFQEKIGIPLQQVSAVVARGGKLSREQREYLYRLLPEENWDNYAPSCADNIKWDSEFDRQYLNETKDTFIKIWLELLPENLYTYIEAYIMNTYGVWGIETRNSEQYYIKDIYPNELGLYQDSPLPDRIRDFIYRFYCNRFTYCYLSAGTAFWVLFLITLMISYVRKYQLAVAFVPIWLCFASLMVATPIAFTFRYVFVLALLFPFLLLLPFTIRKTE